MEAAEPANRRRVDVEVVVGRALRAQCRERVDGVERGGDQRAPIHGVATPRRVEVAPLGERTHGLAEGGTRAGLALVVAIGTTQHAPHALGRGLECLLQPLVDDVVEHPHRDRLQQDLEARVHVGLDGALTQQVGAEAVDGADVGVLEVRERILEAIAGLAVALRACVLDLLAQPELQLARRLLRERDGDDLADARAPLGQRVHHARHQLGGLAGARRGLDDECGVEVRPDAGTVVVVHEGRPRDAHFILRRCVSSARARESFRRGRDCADGPHTAAKSHQWQASSLGAAGSLPS